MTLESRTAPVLHDLSISDDGYQPGACNIGPAEITRRRQAGHVGLAVTIVALVGLVAIDAPPVARLLIALPAATSASGYLQARFKFCAGFGSKGIYNFGELGQTIAGRGRRRPPARQGQVRPDQERQPRDRRRGRPPCRGPSAVTADEQADTTAVAVVDALDDLATILRSHNIEAVVVEDGAEARDYVLGLIPEGAEVHSGKSKTLEDIGLYGDIIDSGRYDASDHG